MAPISSINVTDNFEQEVARLAKRDLGLAREILAEAIRIPADYVDLPENQGGDSNCGTSNHEGPRFEYLKKKVVEIGAVRNPEDVWFDDYGNLVWTLEDPTDGIPRDEKKVIYWDGHGDTVQALRDQWHEKIGGGIDPFLGLTDSDKVNKDFLKGQLGYLPPEEEWKNLIFGRGSADQLGGVVSQVIASKILLELAPLGALKGVIIRSYVTAAEEDNDGGGPRYIVQHILPGAPDNVIPDVVILTEGTGCSKDGALGIYRGQRGRMQIEVSVTGKSCHGSMPWEGLNPLSYGSAIITEATKAYDEGVGFLKDAFLGNGTRTVSWAKLMTPSDCAVPDRFIFRFDRRLTLGETPEQSVADIEALPAVDTARKAGLKVTVEAPTYSLPTWRNFRLNNPQIYPGWATPDSHAAIKAAVTSYKGVITPHVEDKKTEGKNGGAISKQPRVARWVFSTDGVGFAVPVDNKTIKVSEKKNWITSGNVKHPAMFGIGPGIEHNTHKIGECMDTRELQHAIGFMVRFPSAFAATGK